MSCDRHWKLLLGGFGSLVQGHYISKVKSKLCAWPILSFTLSFCWENIVSFVLPLNTNTHISILPFSRVWNEPFHLNPNQSQWDQPVVQWQNMAICPSLIPTAPRLISQPLRVTHWINCLCLQAILCLIVWFISEEEELGKWQVCVRGCLGVCVCEPRDEERCETHAAGWKSEWFYVVPTWIHLSPLMFTVSTHRSRVKATVKQRRHNFILTSSDNS